MSLFNKKGKTEVKKPSQDTLPEFVDSLLDHADLDSLEETEPLAEFHRTHYGIDQAIELMNKLPKDKTELVVMVVKETLSSANVDIDAVITDAQHKAETMQKRMAKLGVEIAELKAQIEKKETETAEAQATLNEALSAKKLLQQSNNNMKSPAAKTGKIQTVRPSVANNLPEEKDKSHKQSQIA